MLFVKRGFPVFAALFVGFLAGVQIAPNRATLTATPASDFRVERAAYDLVYSGQHRQARWVHEHLTREKLSGPAVRSMCDFCPDPLIPEILRASLLDYTRSGFDRGHLCPAADAKFGDEAMRDTFYLSNISPQRPQFNRGCWARLEKHVRNLTEKYKGLHVFTGPLFLAHGEADGKRYVKYQVLGDNDVAVPTHFFKAIFDESGELVEGYILPNEPIDSGTPLDNFRATAEKIERLAGFVFGCG